MAMKRPTKLEPVSKIPSYAVIIRAEWCRGDDQADALVELERRGLWLTEDQKRHAGVI